MTNGREPVRGLTRKIL